MQSPRQGHWEAAMRVLRYLKSSPGQGIILPKENDLKLTAYCDSDFASCPLTRRSVSGFLMKLGAAPLSWKTKKQLQWQDLPVKQNAGQWHMLLVRFCGWEVCSNIYKLDVKNLQLFTVITKKHCNLQQTFLSWKNKTYRNGLPLH